MSRRRARVAARLAAGVGCYRQRAAAVTRHDNNVFSLYQTYIVGDCFGAKPATGRVEKLQLLTGCFLALQYLGQNSLLFI
tara:strand:- start:633 stop:872 length:240 start_codon:yes stop_codon:yes gene_type:complete